MDVSDIARVCHEANRAYCETMEDGSQLPWDNAPEWQRVSAVKGVEFVIDNPGAPASASHGSWLAEKFANGWIYGLVKDVEAKTHPCCVPFEDLMPEQQRKDLLFQAVVLALIAERRA